MKIMNVFANILLLAMAHLTLAFYKSPCTGQDKKETILSRGDTALTTVQSATKT
jgi:hypothetical protein